MVDDDATNGRPSPPQDELIPDSPVDHTESHETSQYSMQFSTNDDTPPAESSSLVPSSSSPSRSNSNPLHSTLGRGTAFVSDWINDHLILARCGALATVGLLTAYGLASSPLFHRYRHIRDIPREYFIHRKRIVGRLVVVPTKDGSPPVVQFRHLAPWERYLPLAWTQFVTQFHPQTTTPTAMTTTTPDNNLLPIHVWGITLDPRIAVTHQPRVVCQLLARGKKRKEEAEKRKSGSTGSSSSLMDDYDEFIEDEEQQQSKTMMMLCGTLSLHHRWGSDVAERWVREGRATVATDPSRMPPGYEIDTRCTTSNDDKKPPTTTTTVEEQQRLLRYISRRLVPAEYEACANHRGVWADKAYREERKDVVEEAEFQTKAKWWQRAWRWVKDRSIH